MESAKYILIVEDDLDDVEIYRQTFLELRPNLAIQHVNNGEEAMDLLSLTKNLPAVIISDINMPRVNGIELRHLMMKKESIELLSIPFLFFSTSSSELVNELIKKLNVAGSYTKPSSMITITAMLEKILLKFSL